MEFLRNKQVAGKAGEIVYNYDCSSCGAPYEDTTEDHFSYCGTPVIDKSRNWVLIDFVME